MYETDEGFREWVNYYDRIFIEKTGKSIIGYIYSKDKSIGSPMDDIAYSNPAIYIIEVSLAKALMAKGIVPDIVIGVSLGEFVASVIAETLDDEDTLKLLIDVVLQYKKSMS